MSPRHGIMRRDQLRLPAGKFPLRGLSVWPARLRRVQCASILFFAFLWAVASTGAGGAGGGPVLHFKRAGAQVAELDLAAIRAACKVQKVVVEDPYYETTKRFWACPLGEVIELGFDLPRATLRGESFLLRALDGYTKPASGSVLLAEGGYLAFADADLSRIDADPFVPRFQPIDRRQLDPAPYYIVWAGSHHSASHGLPRPYQLSTIEIARADQVFPDAAPVGLSKGDDGWRGFELFTDRCISCHAVNGEGGRVGPDLNVPRSIVDYRPVEQIKAYVRDPQVFRYTTMPAHTDLSDEDLEALISYFQAMSARKQDPGDRAVSPSPSTGDEVIH